MQWFPSASKSIEVILLPLVSEKILPMMGRKSQYIRGWQEDYQLYSNVPTPNRFIKSSFSGMPSIINDHARTFNESCSSTCKTRISGWMHNLSWHERGWTWPTRSVDCAIDFKGMMMLMFGRASNPTHHDPKKILCILKSAWAYLDVASQSHNVALGW